MLYTALLAALLLAIIVLSVRTGGIDVSFRKLFMGIFITPDEEVNIIFDLRFPRICISFLAGAALAVSGVLLQCVMKNALADPGIIGISAGANFTSAIVVAFFPSLYFYSPIFAFVGGIIACGLVYLLAWNTQLDPLRIILVGITLSAVFASLYQAINYISGATTATNVRLMSETTLKTWEDVGTTVLYVIIGITAAIFISGKCNLMSLEDKTVTSLGVNVTKLRIIISAIAVLLASVATASVGTISFLALIVPHISRRLVGSNHRYLIPFSALLGATAMLGADMLGRSILYPYEIPPSIIMAIIGGPLFIFLLKRGGKINGN